MLNGTSSQGVWRRLEVGDREHVHMQLWTSTLPKLKQWSDWEKVLSTFSMSERFGRGGKRLWLQGNAAIMPGHKA